MNNITYAARPAAPYEDAVEITPPRKGHVRQSTMRSAFTKVLGHFNPLARIAMIAAFEIPEALRPWLSEAFLVKAVLRRPDPRHRPAARRAARAHRLPRERRPVLAADGSDAGADRPLVSVRRGARHRAQPVRRETWRRPRRGGHRRHRRRFRRPDIALECDQRVFPVRRETLRRGRSDRGRWRDRHGGPDRHDLRLDPDAGQPLGPDSQRDAGEIQGQQHHRKSDPPLRHGGRRFLQRGHRPRDARAAGGGRRERALPGRAGPAGPVSRLRRFIDQFPVRRLDGEGGLSARQELHRASRCSRPSSARVSRFRSRTACWPAERRACRSKSGFPGSPGNRTDAGIRPWLLQIERF